MQNHASTLAAEFKLDDQKETVHNSICLLYTSRCV